MRKERSMLPSGKCPKCQKVVGHARVEHIEIRRGFDEPAWHGVSYVCPSCSTVLGAGIDPVALKTDTVKAIVKELKKGRS
jgi:hypothetical protein